MTGSQATASEFAAARFGPERGLTETSANPNLDVTQNPEGEALPRFCTLCVRGLVWTKMSGPLRL